MLLLALIFELLFVQYTTQRNIEAKCHKDVSLPCSADFTSKKYFSVTWYKNNKEGIIRKDLENMKTRLYSFPRRVSIDEKNGLILPEVTPEDSGQYECAVSANVGEQNVNFFVTLTVSECVTEPTTVRAMTTMPTVEAAGCTHCSERSQELPLVWSLIGYAAMGLTKILLSMLIVWVLHYWTRRKYRR